jgi:transposase
VFPEAVQQCPADHHPALDHQSDPAGKYRQQGEYSIYARLPAWGYVHVTVNHSEGEYARDADGDGINEIHVNTMEGVWSLLRSWLRPHRGISQRFLPLYIGFFQAMHNIRQRGQRPSVLMRAVLDKNSLLGPLLSLLLTSAP